MPNQRKEPDRGQLFLVRPRRLFSFSNGSASPAPFTDRLQPDRSIAYYSQPDFLAGSALCVFALPDWAQPAFTDRHSLSRFAEAAWAGCRCYSVPLRGHTWSARDIAI